MNVKHEMAILLLWLLAVVPTLLIIRQSGMATYLGPLYFLCMVGSVFIVRQAKKNR
jgi:hypothetical protein